MPQLRKQSVIRYYQLLTPGLRRTVDVVYCVARGVIVEEVFIWDHPEAGDQLWNEGQSGHSPGLLDTMNELGQLQGELLYYESMVA